MHPFTILLASAASLAAAVPVTESTSPNLMRRGIQEEMKGECDVTNESHDIPDDYKLRLLVKWEMQGTIDPGSGEPGLGDEGAIFTFTPSCGAISHIGWNGGRGRPDPVRFAGVLPQGDGDPHDIFLSLEMSGALLAGPGIEDPKNIKVVDKDGEEQSGWNVDIRCGKDFSESGWGWAWWKKNCWIKAEKSNCDYTTLPFVGVVYSCKD